MKWILAGIFKIRFTFYLLIFMCRVVNWILSFTIENHIDTITTHKQIVLKT